MQYIGRIWALALVTVLYSLVPATAISQGITGLLPGASSEPESAVQDIDEIMRAAAENGVGVVVIDTNGQVLNQTASAGTPNLTDTAEHMTEGAALMELQTTAVEFRAALIDRLINLPAAFNEVTFILKASSPDGTIFLFFKILFWSLVLFAIGFFITREVYAKRLIKSFVVARIMQNPVGYREKMPFLVFRFCMGITVILITMLTAYIIGAIAIPPLEKIFGVIFPGIEDSAVKFTVTLINIGFFACMAAAQLWRMILSPYLPQYRIPLFNDREAKRLHWWLTLTMSVGFIAILFGIWIGELGLNYEVYAFISSLMSFCLVLLNMLMIAVNRRAISKALRNGRPYSECSLLVRALVSFWVPLAFVYLIFAWGELTYELVLGTPSNIPLIAGAYGIITTIIVVYGVINFFIERSFARAKAIRDLNEAEALHLPPPPEAVAQVRPQITTFEGLARRVAGILAFVAGIYAFVAIWRPDTSMMAGETTIDRLLDVLILFFVGYIVYSVFRIWIDGKIAEESGPEEAELGDEGGGSSASRLATLLPLFRNFILIVIIVTVALITLMELGVNVGPLFAGAGIVGVAVGFGSQSLVRDIFSGAFFLFDDAFRKGEYIDTGGVKGTVENISVRSFQLRHHLGALHTIPFGEIQVLTNYSRDWVIMKLPLRVTYDTDVEKVRKLIKKLGQELLNDPVIGENFIQPLKSQGVIEMQDSAMIIRVKFMTKPGDQWLVRKKVYEEIRLLFEREGINFAHREVTVRLADGQKAENLTEEQKREIAAASRDVIEEEMADAVEMGDDR